MDFPAFWAKGSSGSFTCWRWSHRSLDEAKSLATDAARAVADRFRSGRFDRGNRYAYGDRPLREPVLREFKDAAGATSAVLTRNAYGCLVLNTARAMIVDVDFPRPAQSGPRWLRRLLGKSDPPSPDQSEAATLAQAEAWSQRHPQWGWRVYRTRAGLRLLATHAPLAPDDPSTHAVFESLNADPLYRRLCKAQKSFRARLTPKPWRCGIRERPVDWPWPDSNAEAKFKRWEQAYLASCTEFATCKLVAQIGDPNLHADIAPLVSLHDQTTRIESELPLA
jgi:hypothetical protein